MRQPKGANGYREACKWLRGVDLNHRPLGYEQELQQLTRRGWLPKVFVRNARELLLDSERTVAVFTVSGTRAQRG